MSGVECRGNGMGTFNAETQRGKGARNHGWTLMNTDWQTLRRKTAADKQEETESAPINREQAEAIRRQKKGNLVRESRKHSGQVRFNRTGF